MFGLIISVVAIVLAVFLTAATLYYGGDAVSESKKQADAAALVNQSQQISGAVDLYVADNPNATVVNMADLAPQYLQTIPQGWDLSSNLIASKPGYAAYPIIGTNEQKKDICEEANKKLGIPLPIPECSTVSTTFVGCCATSS